ncbi:MAG: D-alanyl-D-alanine carboxypeptidase family protein [Acidobacteriota bacterium]|nr:D-alanyl-D-alanine carboxypeptidase family protein [Acidobacteriota bacterium]
MHAMRRCLLAALLITSIVCAPRLAQAVDSEPVIDEGAAAVVMDAGGEVLFDRNGEQELPPASITKVMTAMVALDSGIPLDEPIAFVVVEYPEGAQLAGYKDGDTPTLRELLIVSLVYSGNDAAMNVAYAVGGSKEGFADLMNRKVEELGLSHTHFMNPHGLEEEGHYSNARDLCTMGRYALEHYPFIRDAVRMQGVDIVADGKTIGLESTDELLKTYDGMLGIKTGNTESGASFLGAARRDLVTLYSCVLCCETREGRFKDSASLLDWGFGLYAERPLARAERPMRVAQWQDGFWLRCPVSAQRSVNGSVFQGGEVTYQTVMLRPNALVSAGSTYGTTVWSQGDRHVGSVEYRATDDPVRSPAWNPFLLPLFDDA